jgi:pimeloyl-ACP methyl ester carboxylesterase
MSTTILFIHGMYMTPLCWENWLRRMQASGYTCLAPGWPGRDQDVKTLRSKHPDSELANLTLTKVLEHLTTHLQKLEPRPILIGHSMGGLIAQLLLQRGLGSAAIAVHSAPPQGVLSLKWSHLKANWPHINPLGSQPVKLSFEQFQYAFVNDLPQAEQHAAFEAYCVPESRKVPAESLGKIAHIDFEKPGPPLLLLAGTNDHIIPASLNQSNFNKYQRPNSVTEFKEFPRTHFVLGEKNWEEVADYAKAWLHRNGL